MRETTGVSPLVDGLLEADLSVFVDGAWLSGEGEPFACVDPSREAVLGRPRSATVAQVDAAVRSARSAFDTSGWRDSDPEFRAGLLARLADLMDAHHAELVELVMAEVGTPLALARTLQIAQPAKNFRWCADAARRGPAGGYRQHLSPSTGAAPADSVLVYGPVGVVAAITPYNYPLNLVSWKLGPALAAGCTVVLMPSPQGALCAMAFMRLAEEAGFPPGVINFVSGGVPVTSALCEHPGVDLVSFTGSAATGAIIGALAATTNKRVVLELGGKSPNLILPGTDLGAVVGPSILRFARNAGQGCGSTTRILVHESQYDDFVALACSYLKDHVPVGDPRDEATVVGPLISKEHLARVEGYLERAVDGGAQVLYGGDRAVTDQGWYLHPTLIGGISNDAEVSQQELFAPVAVVLSYTSVDEAISIANDSDYALNAAVWGDLDEALRVAERLVSGTVAVNGGGDTRSDVPWGGPKQSGRGSEMGEDGFRMFFSVKHIQWPVST